MSSIPRLLGGLSFLCILIGALLVCFGEGGLFNPAPVLVGYDGHQITFEGRLDITGFMLLILGAVGLIILFSIKCLVKNQPSKPNPDSP